MKHQSLKSPQRIFLSLALLAAALPALLAKSSESIDSDSLKRTGVDAWCWLSIPESRIVLNPYTRVSNGVPPSASDLALDIGYFYGSKTKGTRLDNVLSARLGPDATYTRSFWPHKLEIEAADPGGAGTVRATDFLANTSTVVRILTASRREGGFSVTELSGEISGSVVAKSPEMLVIDHGDFWMVLACGVANSLDRSPASLLSGYAVDGDRWSLRLPKDLPASTAVISGVGFATREEGSQIAMKRASDAVLVVSPSAALAERKKDWDQMLSKVPHPTHFGVSALTSVSPELHRSWYYGAWAFLLQQIMPPLPENEYPYFSIAEGKPSLWAEGDPAAPAQCSWTCFMVMDLVGGIFPQIAWSTYEGIMSRVDDSGVLKGECLPSRKAQGAWLIFSRTGDKDRLARVYPAIKRYLIWREQNPRWIWGVDRGAHDIPDEKDSSFVVSHLIDMDYAMRIATVLGLSEDVSFWKSMTNTELENYRKWFFPKDSPPMNFYFTSSGSYTFKDRQKQEPCYILSGLAFREMPGDLVERLQKYYRGIHDASKPLTGFTFTKYGETSFMAYGLLERNMQPEAKEFISQILVDTMRPGGDFGEELRANGDKVITGGVQPSLFLALQTIDFTLLREGVRIDQGAEVNKVLSSTTPVGTSDRLLKQP